jgi:hypothetical protein
MQNKFNNPDFEKFLYGGVRDLDEPVAELVYNLWKANIQTTWSCSGHIGKWIPSSEKSAIEGHYAYDAGRLHYKITSQSEILTQRLQQVCDEYSFANLKQYNEKMFTLEMEDLAKECKISDKAKQQVPIRQAEIRYQQFLKIWKELTTWSQQLRTNT